MVEEEDYGRCPRCDEDELVYGTDCKYCGWPKQWCENCNGSGVETHYVGTYGTSSCNGPADRPCRECEGWGYTDA